MKMNPKYYRILGALAGMIGGVGVAFVGVMIASLVSVPFLLSGKLSYKALDVIVVVYGIGIWVCCVIFGAWYGHRRGIRRSKIQERESTAE